MSTSADLSLRKDSRDPLGVRSERDQRRAHEARIKFWRVLVVSAFFAVVLGGNLFVGGVMVIKALHSATAETPSSVRIGRMTFPLLDGVFCRHVLIDNETVETREEKVSRCDGQDPSPARRGNGFIWGKQ